MLQYLVTQVCSQLSYVQFSVHKGDALFNRIHWGCK